MKTGRVLRNDFTVAFNNKLYQVEDNVRDRKVIVEERIDGSMIIAHKDKVLKFNEIDVHPKKEESKAVRAFKPKRIHESVPANHPWRSFRFGAHYPQYQQKEKVAPKEKGLPLTVT